MTDLESLRLPMRHPGEEELRHAARRIESWAFEHSRTLHEQPLGHTGSPELLRSLLDEPAPEKPRDFDAIFRRFESQIAHFGYVSNHPRFLAFVPGAPTVPAMLGDWLTSAVNLFSGVWLEASGASQVELTVLRWFAEILGYPPGFRGILTGGGSEANLTALVTARESIPWEDRKSAVVYVSEQRHYSIDRAAKIVGLHPSQIHPVPDDGDLRLRGQPLLEQVRRDRSRAKRPWLVVANGGATNTGIVDALNEIAEVCQQENLWFHIDAALGWAAALTAEGREQLRGIDRADSITLDPHKWFAQTFEAGCVLVRDGHRLHETFALRPDYMQDVIPQDEEINFADHGIALTRRFRALKIWFSVQMLGLNWFRELVERNMAMAEYTAQRIDANPTFELLSAPHLCVVCFRYRGSEAENERRVRLLRERGVAFLSSTRLRGIYAIRMCFVNWRTTSTDVDLILNGLLEA